MGQYICIYNMFCCQCGATVWCCLYHSYGDWSLPTVRSYLNFLFIMTQQESIWCYQLTFISMDCIVLQFMFYFLLENWGQKEKGFIYIWHIIMLLLLRILEKYRFTSVLLTNEIEDLSHFRYILIVKTSFLLLHG